MDKEEFARQIFAATVGGLVAKEYNSVPSANSYKIEEAAAFALEAADVFERMLILHNIEKKANK